MTQGIAGNGLGILDYERVGQWMAARRETAAAKFLAEGAPRAMQTVKITQADAAVAAGVTSKAVSSWERGATIPSIESFVGWAEGLGYDAGEALASLVAFASKRRAE